nr:zinc-dependent metalloprotease [Nocardia cyriacigeorgica]
MDRFNTVWTDAETLPRPDEIEDPQRWISRVLG